METATIRVWQIGPDGTEYYAAHSEKEMKDWYVKTVGEEQAAEDFQDFEEIDDLDTPMPFEDDGQPSITTWRKLAAECGELPAQISTGYN